VTNKDGQIVGALEVGMVFESEKDAYEMYNAYVEHDEFSIRKSNTKCRADKTIYSKLVVCSSKNLEKLFLHRPVQGWVAMLLCLNSTFA
jgi:hypothetical protein